MIRVYCALAIWFSFLAVITSFSQTTDSLTIAREIRDGGDMPGGLEIMRRYVERNPNDLNGHWLLGQTFYWMKDFRNSRAAYQRAIEVAPDNLYLQLDYARVLLNSRKYRESRLILEHLLTYKETKQAATVELARHHYWTGRFTKAKRLLAGITLSEPDEKLLSDIAFANAMTIGAAVSYFSDTQPLTGTNGQVRLSKALTPALAPFAEVSSDRFSMEGPRSTFSALVGNRFRAGGLGSTIAVQGGYFTFPDKTSSAVTYKLSLSQRLFKSATLEITHERKPYLQTIASFRQPLLVNTTGGFVNLGTEKTLHGRIGFERNLFEDHNTVNSSYAYLLTRAFGSPNVKIALGYAFAFNNSAEDRFVAGEQPLPGPGPNGNTGTIEGVYDPYFTPTGQFINSALLNLNFKLSPQVALGANTSVAFYAVTSTPFFYVEQQGPVREPIKGFASTTYTPYSIAGFASFRFSSGSFIRADYNFTSTFFYERNSVTVSFGGFLR